MVLFVANTLAQLMNAVVIKQRFYTNDKCDLYYKPVYHDIAFRMKEIGVFNNIFESPSFGLTTRGKSFIKNGVRRIRTVIYMKQLRRSFPTDPMQYKKVLLSSDLLRILEIYYVAKRINREVELYLYEEGMLEYNVLHKRRPWYESFFSKVFFQHFFLEECIGLYVYRPEYVRNEKWHNIKIYEIGTIDNDIRRVLNYVFNVNTSIKYLEKYRFVYLDQTFPAMEDALQRELVFQLRKVIDENDMAIKLHPRSNKNKYSGYFNLIEDQIPFELICLGEAIEDLCFLTIYSSAVLALKMSLNSSCKVVFLIKALNQMKAKGCPTNMSENDELILRLIADIKKDNKNTVFIPDSLDDLHDLLIKLQ